MAHATASQLSHEAPAAGSQEAGEEQGGWFVPLLLLLATTAITAWALIAPRLEPAAPPPVAAPAVAPDAGALGALVERTVAPGVLIRVPERGVEGRLLAFVQDASRPVDRTTWFDFDRLTFETASATLGAGSQDQLAAVGAILSAYPAVKLKIGGYTDNVGDPASNQRLSEQRATNVRAALVQLGVAPDRLTAEGYGEQFPVGDNATAEGRALNRRISMRVTEK